MKTTTNELTMARFIIDIFEQKEDVDKEELLTDDDFIENGDWIDMIYRIDELYGTHYSDSITNNCFITIDVKEIQVPEWADYVAQDPNGEWMFYSSKPIFEDGCWTLDCIGPGFDLAIRAKAPKNASKEVYRIHRV